MTLRDQGGGPKYLADVWTKLTCHGVFLLLSRPEMSSFNRFSYVRETANPTLNQDALRLYAGTRTLLIFCSRLEHVMHAQRIEKQLLKLGMFECIVRGCCMNFYSKTVAR